MARRSFDDETLAWVREMPLSQVLDKLRDDGQLFWRRDPDFVPEKDKRTVRLFLSSPSGFAWEVLVTGLKWFDVRAGKGGGGGIDLVMHLLGIDFVKAVNGFCKDYTDRLGEVVMITKKKIGAYQYQQELERRKQEEAARKAAQELQDKLRREAEEAARHEIQAPIVTAPVIPVQEKVTRTETGAAAHVRKVWKAEVVNEAEIPREYLTVDMKKVNDAVRMGAREIPGVRIFEEVSTVFRT